MDLLKAAKRRLRRWRQRPEPSPEQNRPADKAGTEDIIGRFREVVSDPLNLLIERDPRAGFVADGLVYLHNGHRVAIEGELSYYGRYSELLAINRGVHEPLEELVFQELMRVIPAEPTMLELGAYWGHYSMWMKKLRPRSKVFLVEPMSQNIDAGRANFARHGYEGEFIQSMVSKEHFTVDGFLKGDLKLDILHSDIQGYEIEMLQGCTESFRRKQINYVFISTHSQVLHDQVVATLSSSGMRTEVSSGFDDETTSFDGFVFGSRVELPSVFLGFRPMGRREIAESDPEKIVSYLGETLRVLKKEQLDHASSAKF